VGGRYILPQPGSFRQVVAKRDLTELKAADHAPPTAGLRSLRSLAMTFFIIPRSSDIPCYFVFARIKLPSENYEKNGS
jgi:hypothetical protein